MGSDEESIMLEAFEKIFWKDEPPAYEVVQYS